MKALVYTGPHSLEMRDVAEPQVGNGEALIQVDCACICGSDMHAYLGHDERRPAPCILGHEISGVVIDGLGARDRIGQRVTINPLVSCGTCGDCKAGRTNLCASRQIISMPPREGGFAEQLSMPWDNLIPVPDHIDMEQAALTEPIACGWHGIRSARRMLNNELSASCCVILGGGSIGLGAALVLHSHKVADVSIVETNPVRRQALQTALRHTEYRVLDIDQASALKESTVDLVVDAAGFEATRASACRMLKPGGVLVHIGLAQPSGGLDIRRMTLQEISFIGAYTYTSADFYDTAQALFRGDLGPLNWTEIRPFAEGGQAFADLLQGKVAAPKIVLKL